MGVPAGSLNLENGQRKIYFKIPLDLYKDGDVVERDLYMLYQGNYIVYRARNSVWTLEDTRKLTEFGALDLYISCNNESDHFKFIESSLNRILEHHRLRQNKKLQFSISVHLELLKMFLIIHTAQIIL